MEAWVGRETLTAKLPPSRLALDPGDVVSLSNDGRLIDYRITRIGDAGARAINAIRTDAAIYDLPPGQQPARQSARCHGLWPCRGGADGPAAA